MNSPARGRPPHPPATPVERLDAMVERLAARSSDWTAVGPGRRAELLRRCMDGIARVATAWVHDACRARGLEPGADAAGETWLAGPMVILRNLRLLAESLERLERRGRLPTAPLRRRADGRWVADVHPSSLLDRAVFPGLRAELRIRPGEPPSQGRIYRRKTADDPRPGGVAVVLGAGNVSSIAPLDVAHQLFVEDRVVLLKMHPVIDYLGPHLEAAFRPLIENGFLSIVYGGADTGDTLCRHPAVDAIHLTGSHRTHDAIVWGADLEERARRREAGTPRIDARITSELGCVTPVLVVPGGWSEPDLERQARQVAAMVTNNASFNCNAAKVLLTARDWPLRGAFLDRVAEALARVPPRPAYYPGAAERYGRFLEEYPDHRVLEPPTDPRDLEPDPDHRGIETALDRSGGGTLPWTLIPGVDPDGNDFGLRREAFCGVLMEVPLPGGRPEPFLGSAVPFANERLWGTLSCVLLVSDEVLRSHRLGVEGAVDDLRYGTVGVNVWSGVGFALGSTSWGGYPGHRLEEIGSGIGTVHNAYLFDRPERSVIRMPFRPRPEPPWFAGHGNLWRLGRRLTGFEADPSWSKVPGLALEALIR